MLRGRDDRDRLVEELHDRIQSLERRLDEAEASRRRADDIIEQLTQANTAHPEQRMPEIPKPGSPDDALPSRPWWQETLKTTFPQVVAPLVTATASGLITVLAAVEGAAALAVVSFVVSVISAVIATFFGIRLHGARRQQAATRADIWAETEEIREAVRQAAEEGKKASEDVIQAGERGEATEVEVEEALRAADKVQEAAEAAEAATQARWRRLFGA